MSPSVPNPRDAVLAMKAYVPPLEGRRRSLRLDFNENSVGFPEQLPHYPPELLTTYPEYGELRRRLADHLEVPVESLLLTNGSDEGLFVAAFTFIEPGRDRAVVSSPTFALIPHYLRLCQAQVQEVPVQEDLRFDLDALGEALKGARMGMFASPDNPTGDLIPLPTQEAWLRDNPETVLVMDEAYGEYSGQTALDLLKTFPNLLISRTFSKAWGLAGLRLGVMLAHPELVSWMSVVRSPYSVNALAVKTMLEFLPRSGIVRHQAGTVLQTKRWVLDELHQRGFGTTAGHANFFLLWVGRDGPDLCAFMAERGVLVRDRSHLPGMKGSVRVSVGSRAQMDLFLEVLDQFRNRRAVIFDLDDTLVDTSLSYDSVIAQLVEGETGRPLDLAELQALRAEGGFNDDWEAAAELIHRRGSQVPLDRLVQKARELYLALAADNETLLVDLDWLKALARRHKLFIYTGRPRSEYEPVWGERLDGLFEGILCLGDEAGVRAKPAPDGLNYLKQQHQIDSAVYVGNSVDDMACARQADCLAVGVATNQQPATLYQAGADLVFDHSDEVKTLWMLEKRQ